jgi:hypothetical protein
MTTETDLSTVITNACPICGHRSKVQVELDNYIKWLGGVLAQVAFPDYTDSERELLVTGTHPSCWDILFSEEE